MSLVRVPYVLGHRFSTLASLTRVSEEDVRRFEEDGAVVLRKMIGNEWLEQLSVAADRNMATPGPLCDEHVPYGQPGRFHDDQFLWLRHQPIRSFIFESSIASIARRMMRSTESKLFYDQLLVKEPGTETRTPWHNDHSYWQLEGDKIISIWLALDPVPQSACVQYVKGSHKWKLLHKIASFSGDGDRYRSSLTDSLPDAPNIDAQLDKVEILKWEMEAGDCLVHHSYAVHGAGGVSVENGRRRGYATRWIGKDVRYDPRPGTMHYQWIKAGFNPSLNQGDLITSSLFPTIS